MRTFSLLFFKSSEYLQWREGWIHARITWLHGTISVAALIDRSVFLQQTGSSSVVSHWGKKIFSLSGGLPMLLAKVMKGKSAMTCIKISSGTMQLEVCHSTFAFHSFCHGGAELETIKQRITSSKGLSGSSLVFSPSFFLEHTAVLESSYSFRICCFVYFWGVCRSQAYIYVSDSFI